MTENEYKHRKKFMEDIGKCFRGTESNKFWFDFMDKNDFSDESILTFMKETQYPGNPEHILEAIKKNFTLAQYLADLFSNIPSVLLSDFKFITILPKDLVIEIMENMENHINKKKLQSLITEKNNYAH